MSPPITPPEIRFWEKVDKSSNPSGCWIWRGATSKGYGSFRLHRGQQIWAHRFSWELTNGPVPDGEGYHGTVVMHICDTPPCVNPDHLRLGTTAENNADRAAKRRSYRPVGTLHPQALLTDEDVREIRRLLAAGMTQKSVAAKYRIHRNTVYMIRTGRNWSHVS